MVHHAWTRRLNPRMPSVASANATAVTARPDSLSSHVAASTESAVAGVPVRAPSSSMSCATHTGNAVRKWPLISAKKIGGEPSYKLARRGMPIQSPAVPVEVERFELLSFDPPLATFRVVCSAGTYVRSLAHDLGQQLGCGAHLESLRRLRSGDFGIEQAVRLDRATAADVIPMENLLAQYPSITVEGDIEEDRVRHGNPVATTVESGLACIFNKEGEFLAVASVESGWARPRVVLISVASAEPRKPH